MPWKMNGEVIELKDGNPVWTNDDGSEVVADYGHALNKIGELNKESAGRKTKLREAEDKLKVLDGIEDPADYLGKAKKAFETVKNLDDKQLVDAGEVEKVKAQIKETYEAKLTEATKKADEAESILKKEMIGGKFGRSKYIQDKIAVPVDMIEATFGKHFVIEEGKVVAKGHDGSTILSREKPGDMASFDEALSILVDGYSSKDAILKGSEASGGGANPGGSGGGQGGEKKISRATYDKMSQRERTDFFGAGGTIKTD